ncbi:MAG: hypothetical protein R3C05_29505 [Pirellulaceae bacterium]
MPHIDEVALGQQDFNDPKFTHALTQGLISTAAEAGSLKEQFIESLVAETPSIYGRYDGEAVCIATSRDLSTRTRLVRFLMDEIKLAGTIDDDWVRMLTVRTEVRQTLLFIAIPIIAVMIGTMIAAINADRNRRQETWQSPVSVTTCGGASKAHRENTPKFNRSILATF